MFHISSDPSGSGAIWAAQRVPDDHVAAVANQFVIREIDLKDSDNVMGSANMLDVRKDHGVWNKEATKIVPYDGIFPPPP